MSRHISAVATAAVVLLASSVTAIAQGICNAAYPIRATGSACSSSNAVGHITRPTDGVVVCCLAAASSRPSIQIPSGGDRYAAGLQLGVAGAGIVLDLIRIFGPSVFGSGETALERYDRESAQRNRELSEERRRSLREAARWHDAAMREVKKGDMRSAEGFLIKAARLAEDGNDRETSLGYAADLNVLLATKHMKEGLALQAEGRIFAAEEEMNKAAFYAEKSGRPDLGRRIRDYRQTLVAQRSPGKTLRERYGMPPKITEKSTCLEVNGKVVCD